MKRLEVVPHEGIGPLKLGMSPEELVKAVKTFSSCTCDWEDEQLGTDYVFPELGIRLWREEPFHPKLLSDKAYMEQMKMVIDEMYRYLRFEIIGVR